MLTTRFPFIYCKYLSIKTLSISLNRNFESCLSIHCLHLSTFYIFSNFAAGFFLCLWQLCPLISRDKKKCLQWVTFPGKSWSIVIDVRRSCYPITLRFQEANELFVNFYGWKTCDFERNTTTLSEFTGSLSLTDFRQISPKHSSNNDKREYVGNFDVWNICPVGPFTQHAL